MTETEYKDNYATGTRPGILYGLPKLHKENIPVRPVLSARKTPLYTFSKFLIQFIENFTSNEFTLKNNMQLVDDLKNLQLNSESYMVSYDIESLYTNIPIDETIQILLDQMNEENLVRNAEKKELKRMLLQATGNSYFIFNGQYYKQKEGLAMGQPLSTPLANAFLAYHEKKWIQDCPSSFKPSFYRRYVDDTYVIFNKKRTCRTVLYLPKFETSENQVYKRRRK